MKIKFIIPTVGDGGNEITSSFLLRITSRQKHKYRFFYSSTLDKEATSKNRKKLGLLGGTHIATRQEMRDSKVFKYSSKSLNKFGEHCINCPSVTMNNVSSGVDPVLRTVSREIERRLFPTKDWDRDKEDFMNSITFKYFDGNVRIIYGRTNNRYYMNTIAKNKTDIVNAIGKIIIRGSLSRSSVQMREYLKKVTTFPHNVLYALENRTPYHFSENFRKTDVVINTKLISDKECVLEISDSTWGVLSVKELNTFIDYFKFNKKRSKKWNIGVTNEFLWTELMGSPPTRTELEKMKQWLLQHRTSDIVEDRATKLLFDIAAETPQIDFVQFKNPKNKALFVHGKYSDWVITYTGDGMKRGNQDVSTHQIVGFSDETERGNRSWHGMKLSGSICIDNVSKGASIGDQLTARALALINEDVAAHHLYTIKPLITDELRSGEKVMPRLDRSKLNHWSQIKCDEYLHKKRMKENN
jgi:hypothetical protein